MNPTISAPGHSSLSYLMALPIDRCFTARVGPDGARRALANALIGFGTTLGMDVSAEAVEAPPVFQVPRPAGG